MNTLRRVARGSIAFVVLAAALAATADETVETIQAQIKEVEARLEEQSMAVGDLRENLERRVGFDELRSWSATLEPSIFQPPEVSETAERYRGTFEPTADRPHSLEQVEKEIRYAEDNLPGARNQDRKQGFEKRLETWKKIREAILVELDEIAQTRYGMGYAALEKMARELDADLGLLKEPRRSEMKKYLALRQELVELGRKLAALQFEGTFQGTWDATEFGTLELKITSRDRVRGTYSRILYEGRIEGRLSPDGRRLTGTWRQGSMDANFQSRSRGAFEIQLAPDGKSFSGTYTYRGASTRKTSWSAKRR